MNKSIYFDQHNKSTISLHLQDIIKLITILKIVTQFYQQQIKANRNFPMTQFRIYFAFGPQRKSSLIAHFCRQNDYIYQKSPSYEDFMKNFNRNAIVEGSLQLFRAMETQVPLLQVIFFGKQVQSEQQLKIRNDYCSIGKCKRVYELNQSSFKKQMYPNLIFFYGPINQQIQAASQTMAMNIGYCYSKCPQNANQIISHFNKSSNYVFDGMFRKVQDFKILQEYFTFKIIHFQHNPIDYPNLQDFFNNEISILKYLKGKQYYHCFNGADTPIKLMDDVGLALCPELIFVNRTEVSQVEYIHKYINDTDGLLLGIMDIISVKKRKNLPLTKTPEQRCLMLTQIIFKDLGRKQVVISDFPFKFNQFQYFENLNRKFKCFADLTRPEQYQYQHNEFTPAMWFLERQQRFVPHIQNPLKAQLNQFFNNVKYWIVNGPSGSGRSTVAKFISNQFGYKLVEFEPFLASLKEKLLTPQDGQQLPLKKICAHVSKMIKQEKQNIYVFDGFPYDGNDLSTWLQIVGPPRILNLRVEQQSQIKRARKKAQADVNAEITQEEKVRVKQSTQKNVQWVAKINEQSISSVIFTIDYNMPSLLAEDVIISVMRPRVFLIQRHQSLIFQNLALKYNMAFIDLQLNNLNTILPKVKNCRERDLILCNYSQQNQRLVSEDLYWIQKNIGPIRYIAAEGQFINEDKQCHEQKLRLERPPVQVKPKKKQGQQGEEEPPAEEAQGQQGAKKKEIDIYEYEWTKPSAFKNLSQWIFKSKKSIFQKNINPGNAFQTFDEVLKILNENRNNVVYGKIN